MPVFLLPFLAGAKSFLNAALTFFSKPPGTYIAMAAGCVIALWWFGQHEFNKGAQSIKAAQARAAVVITERRSQITFDVGMNFEMVHLKDTDATAKRQEEVSQHVTAEVDRDFPVPCSFVWVFNNATHGPLPDPASCPNDTPSGVTLSTVGHTETENDGQYDAIADQLIALQNWVKQQQAVKP